ncbi:tRNA lysidine(34) synthetase TilS [Defluviitalea phaphyphila]|uniref:tRNA lysidine(34) synthetase TilS n=1 Tax=Defluviitalea phaphyphila TaxID=1473580 RepID=UPI000730D641|nr:tRNA lysidine(34) synthetase TilS [Defluviitalea phaphyphila]
MLHKFYNTIKKYNMITMGDKIIVGVSGGADSMCLLHLLKELSNELDFSITVVHVNHGLRGKDAQEDAEFVENICKEWGIAFNLYHIDIKKEAKKRKCSEEEAGRILRYEIFEEERKKVNGNKIAIAHNMNDQAETVLMQLFRGSGLKGLGGISPVRGNIIRPLLEITREEIEDYCVKNHIEYRHDYTNDLNIYTRNKIRNEIIPLIKENINPNIVKTLYNMSTIIKEEDIFLDKKAKSLLKEAIEKETKNYLVINNIKFNSYDDVIKKRIIRIILEKLIGSLKDIASKHILDIIELSKKGTGKKINLPKKLVVKTQYDELIFQLGETNIQNFFYKIDIPSSLFIEEIGLTIETKLLNREKFTLFNQDVYTKSFDYDKIEGSLCIRTRKPGDRIILKNGNKKLKDFFIDSKIPRDEREKIPLLADGNKILWVIGYRYSDAYKITANTNRILQVKVSK